MSDRIKISFDGGTSLTKIIYQVFKNDRKGKIYHATWQPEVLKLMEAPRANNFSANAGWVQLSPKKAKEYYAVGKRAKNLGMNSSIRRLKYEGFVPKILAAVGDIVAKFELTERIDVDLYSLLPYSEYENRQALEKALRQALRAYWYGGKKIRASLDNYCCYPEGLGIALEIRRRLSKPVWSKKKIGILIFGYRNTSWLVFEDGVFSQTASATTSYGFWHLLDFAASSIPGVSREEIQDAIYSETVEYIDRKQQKRFKRLETKINWKRLVKETNSEAINSCIAKTEKALNNGKLQYWELLSNLLYEVQAPTVDTIYYAGGSGLFIRDKLVSYCSEEKIPLVSSLELEQITSDVKILPPLSQVLDLSQIELQSFTSQNLELRYKDNWFLFTNITNYHDQYFANQPTKELVSTG